jgi:hypothetical protein
MTTDQTISVSAKTGRVISSHVGLEDPLAAAEAEGAE